MGGSRGGQGGGGGPNLKNHKNIGFRWRADDGPL